MNKAKAAVMVGVNQPFEIREFELVAPPAGMAKMKLIASGVCGTDIHIHKGKIPAAIPSIIGHEFVGAVEEISEADAAQYDIHTGDRVIVDIACPCGECALCREGDDANCLHMGLTNGGNPEEAPHLYGGYAEYNYSPVKNLIKIPEGLDAAMTCVFACAGPTSLHAFRLAGQAGCHVEKANVAVVQGTGPVGLFAVMYLKSLNIKNIAVITAGNNTKREQLVKRLGATHVYSLRQEPAEVITQKIRSLNDGMGADLVYEASGNPGAVPQGLELLRNRGTYLVPGQYSNSGTVEIAPQLITFNALHIIGSSQYSVSDVKDYLGFLKENPHLHAVISELADTYKVEEVNQAMEELKAGKNVKTMLVP